jgi:nucleotide-binding universal stress UspA family protein
VCTKEDAVIDLRTPSRPGDVAAADRRRAAGVLVVALDDAGLAEALPVAAARAAASGGRVTVAGPGFSPWWWCLSASGWVLVPHLTPGHMHEGAVAALRARVEQVAPDSEVCVVCHRGPIERWLARELRRNAYEAVLVGAGRITGRRTRRLAAVCGEERTFAVLSPL